MLFSGPEVLMLGFDTKRNNFDFVRLFFALSVVLAHSGHLSDNPSYNSTMRFFPGPLAIDVFFVISGFLIFMSFEHSRSLKDYTVRRLRRIYPAYIAVVLVCAFSGFFLSTASLREYFSVDWLKYVAANLTFMNFLHPELPGLFTDNVFQAVNGSLWTLKVEAMFYIAVPFFVLLLRKYNKLMVMILIYAASVIYHLSFDALHERTGSFIYYQFRKQLPGQMSLFISGAFLYYYFEFFRRHATAIVIAAITGFALALFFDACYFLRSISIAVIVVYVALCLRYLGNWGKYGDITYGVYIWHFPIIQVLVAQGLFEKSPFLALALSGCILCVAAFASWHIVEKPFLMKKSHYRVAAEVK